MATYKETTISPGDSFSKIAKTSCEKGYQNNLFKTFLNGKGNTIRLTPDITDKYLKNGADLCVSIDGEGTKGQIYEAMFDEQFSFFISSLISEEKFKKFCVDLWERRLHDLIAMNTDDLLDGSLCYNLTLYIHFEHLNGRKGEVLKETMTQAMQNVSEREGVSIVAGETALMGHTPKERKLVALLDSVKAQVNSDIDYPLKEFKIELKDILKGRNPFANLRKYIEYKGIEKYNKRAKEFVECGLDKIDNKKSSIMQGTYFSLVGTAQGIKSLDHEKLVPLEAGHAVVMFEEQGEIKGPRANGISAIRRGMTQLFGERWASIEFVQFIRSLNTQRERDGLTLLDENSFSPGMYEKCTGKTMGEIATGKTTIYNQFIVGDLLGGIENKPKVDISTMAHITGNPLKKLGNITNGNSHLMIDIDLKDVELCPIMEILQVCGICFDKEATQQWNMGLPKVITCQEDQVLKIKEEAKANGYIAKKIGNVVIKDDVTCDVKVRNIGVNKSTFSYNKKLDKIIHDDLIGIHLKYGQDDSTHRYGDISTSSFNEFVRKNKQLINSLHLKKYEGSPEDDFGDWYEYTIVLKEFENNELKIDCDEEDKGIYTHLNIIPQFPLENTNNHDKNDEYFMIYEENKQYTISISGGDTLMLLGKYVNESLYQRRSQGILNNVSISETGLIEIDLNVSNISTITLLTNQGSDDIVGFGLISEEE